VTRRTIGFKSNLLRPATGEAAHRVTYIELFFDLVFVFAITQISHILIGERSGSNLVHTLVLALVVWWAWVYTTWATSWLDPERGWVRALLLVLMALGMLMSSAIPGAFTDKALLFACSLVAFHLSRSVFTIFVFARRQPDHAINFVRITIWHAVPGALWIWGALAPEDLRLWIWLIALAIDYAGPRARFWTPGLGASGLETWNISGEHMAERVSLFLIIALGESIIVTGATFSTGALTWLNGVGFLAAFVSTVLMWLLYFNHSQRRGSEYIARAAERGMIAQTAFSYVPLLLILGIVLTAVADELVLREPSGPTNAWTAGLLCGASAVYLLGNALFKRATGSPWLFSHLVAILVLAAVFAAYPLTSPLVLSWITNAVLLVVVIFDEASSRRHRY
jgi:low temperature requirement protein LtrA